MDRLKSEFLKSMKFNPLVWSGYINDIFFIWTHGEEKIKSVLDKLSKYQPNIKFKYQPNIKFAIKESIPFLDLVVKLSNKKIVIDLFIKDTNRYQYLHHTSLHPEHSERYIVYNQTLRISRVVQKKKIL